MNDVSTGSNESDDAHSKHWQLILSVNQGITTSKEKNILGHILYATLSCQKCIKPTRLLQKLH